MGFPNRPASEPSRADRCGRPMAMGARPPAFPARPYSVRSSFQTTLQKTASELWRLTIPAMARRTLALQLTAEPPLSVANSLANRPSEPLQIITRLQSSRFSRPDFGVTRKAAVQRNSVHTRVSGRERARVRACWDTCQDVIGAETGTCSGVKRH